jgi:hypothetical protein
MVDKVATLKKMDALYEKFVLPVEAEHYGEFVVLAEDGRMVFGPTLTDALALAREELGRGTFSYKVGERVVGRLR